MPQIMIDSTVATPVQMRAAARFLEELATLAESGAAPTNTAVTSTAGLAPPQLPAFGAPLPAGASAAPIPPAPPAPPVPSGTVETPPPPSPPAPSVQTAATPAVPPATSGVSPELDSEGFPWDERIHAATKTKVKAGTWKYRKGVDPTTIQTVEAELRQRFPKPVAAPPPPPAQQSFVPPAPPPPSTVVLPAAGSGVSAPPPPPPAGLPGGSPADAFRLLMQKIAPHMTPNGKLALTVLAPIYQRLGVSGLEAFAKPGAPIAQMNAEVDAILGVQA